MIRIEFFCQANKYKGFLLEKKKCKKFFKSELKFSQITEALSLNVKRIVTERIKAWRNPHRFEK